MTGKKKEKTETYEIKSKPSKDGKNGLEMKSKPSKDDKNALEIKSKSSKNEKSSIEIKSKSSKDEKNTLEIKSKSSKDDKTGKSKSSQQSNLSNSTGSSGKKEGKEKTQTLASSQLHRLYTLVPTSVTEKVLEKWKEIGPFNIDNVLDKEGVKINESIAILKGQHEFGQDYNNPNQRRFRRAVTPSGELQEG